MTTKQGRGRMTRYHHLTRDRCRECLLAGWTPEAMRIGTTGSRQNDNDDNWAERGGDSGSDGRGKRRQGQQG
jgi:hypothetical protein